MKRIHLAVVIVLIALVSAGLSLVGCSEKPTGSGIPGGGNLSLNATLSTTAFLQQVDLFRLRVLGVGVDTTFLLDFDGRYISGQVDVPAGERLTFILTAEEIISIEYDSTETFADTTTIVIYQGVTESLVAPGVQVQISITLEPTVPMVRLTPKYTQVTAGDPLILELTVHNIMNLGAIAVAIDFGYATQNVEPVSARLSPSLDSTRVGFIADFFNDNTLYVVYAIDTVNGRIVDANGNGTIAEIRFNTLAFASGMSRVQDLFFTEATFADANGDSIPSANVYLEDAQVELVPLTDSVITFPDAELERVIRSAANVPTGASIRLSDVLSITYLDVREYGISSIEGMQSLLNLSFLDIGYNSISDMSPLAGLPALSNLGISTTGVEEISFLATLPSLRTLEASGNDLTDADAAVFAQLTQVRNLDVSFNQLVDISWASGLLELYQINLAYNDIVDILPLLQNAEAGGLSQYDIVDVSGCPLNVVSQQTYIPTLQETYLVTVYYGTK